MATNGRPRRRASLSRESIVEATLTLTADGEQVTFRALGAALGVDPTSVFRHFRDKDELVRAVGADEVVALLDQLGLASSFALFRRQPAWRGRDLRASLVRFAGAGSGRKERLAGLLAAALPLDALPEPLAQLLTQVEQARVDEHGPSLGVFAEGVAPAPGG